MSSLLRRYISSEFFKISVFAHSFIGMGCGTMYWCSSPPNNHLDIDIKIGEMILVIGGGAIGGGVMGAAFPISHMVLAYRAYRAIMYEKSK